MNIIECIGKAFPGVFVSCQGDMNDYASIKWEGGEPMPTQAQVQAAMLDFRRSLVWDKLQVERDWREQNNGTPVTLNGVTKWFHSDDPSKIKQLALVKAADLGKMPLNLEWKTMEKDFVIMTGPLAYDIYIGAMTMSTHIFAVAEMHRKAIYASNDPESYDFSQGWPQTFAEWKAQQV